MLFLSLALFCSHPELLLFLLLCFFLVVIFFKYLLFIYLNLKKKRGGDFLFSSPVLWPL